MKTRARIMLGICAVLLTAASLLAPGVPPAEAVNRPCCLDEWQGGGICADAGGTAPAAARAARARTNRASFLRMTILLVKQRWCTRGTGPQQAPAGGRRIRPGALLYDGRSPGAVPGALG